MMSLVYMMQLGSVSVSPLDFLGQEDGGELQHDFLGHMIPFSLASTVCHANSIVNATIALQR